MVSKLPSLTSSPESSPSPGFYLERRTGTKHVIKGGTVVRALGRCDLTVKGETSYSPCRCRSLGQQHSPSRRLSSELHDVGKVGRTRPAEEAGDL